MNKRMLFVLGFVAGLVMFGSAAHSAPITGQASWPMDTRQYDTYAPDWVYMTWGQLPEPLTILSRNYTITARGTGTETDPFRFEVSPEITIVPSGSIPNFSRSNPWQNLLEFRDWVECLPVQPQRTQVPEPSVLAMLLLGLVGVSAYRKKSN